MSSQVQGIQNFNKMEDKDKVYLIKLFVIIMGAILSGIITGLTYNGEGNTWVIGFGIFILLEILISYFLKTKYDLGEMTNSQVFRIGIVIGLLTYIFLWTVIFNFIVTG